MTVEQLDRRTVATSTFELDVVMHAGKFDALPAMRIGPRSTRRGYRFPIDLHLTPEGHAAFADAVEDEVVRILDLTGRPDTDR